MVNDGRLANEFVSNSLQDGEGAYMDRSACAYHNQGFASWKNSSQFCHALQGHNFTRGLGYDLVLWALSQSAIILVDRFCLFFL